MSITSMTSEAGRISWSSSGVDERSRHFTSMQIICNTAKGIAYMVQMYVFEDSEAEQRWLTLDHSTKPKR